MAFFVSQVGFACDCEMKPILDIRDWNDSDIVFTGVLTQIVETEEIKNLTFSISTVYKGSKSENSIHFSVWQHEDHDVFHHVRPMFVGQEWIVFGSSFMKNDELIYEFKEPSNKDYCLLIKPIDDNDPYVTFVKEIVKHPNTTDKTYYRDTVMFAVGNLENTVASGMWKYFESTKVNIYWEGYYVDGKRDGKWVQKAMYHEGQPIIIKEELYQNGRLKEHVRYTKMGETNYREHYGEMENKRTIYQDNVVTSTMTVDKVNNTTTISYYREGRITRSRVIKGRKF
jgi:hypothetical protein